MLALPVQHRLKCDAVVQPASRRFAVAPYAGVLRQAAVKPGDLVRANDVLAVMDDRELNWELAGLVADRDRAAKQRDSKLASKQVADMQMAQLEMQRLQLKIALLEHRKMNLKIRSPVDGVIIRGDLEDAEGAPVESGQSLFEVAPLDDLRFDVAIPDHDITFAHHGMEVDVSLEALPGRVLKGTVERLHPRAEINDAANVFIAEVALDVEEDALRPGMKGQARLLGSRRSLGWILFHRPWYRLVNYVR
jgi:multidrug resistance efflux pump